MLQRSTMPGPLIVYESPLLRAAGVRHGFSTRHGGVSPAPFDSLNLAALGAPAAQPAGDGCEKPDGDNPLHGIENYARLRRAIGCDHHRMAWVRQVHGAGVEVIDQGNLNHHPDADGVVTQLPGTLLTIRVADCVPILLATGDGRTVAAAHAGWRGVVAGVVPATVAKLRQRRGVGSADLVAAVGPCISAEHFEVGPEVADEFIRAGLGGFIRTQPRWPKPHIDLPAAVASQLTGAGVLPDRIDATDQCTFAHAEDFFSHRRDRGRTGRLAAVIAVRD